MSYNTAIDRMVVMLSQKLPLVTLTFLKFLTFYSI